MYNTLHVENILKLEHMHQLHPYFEQSDKLN